MAHIYGHTWPIRWGKAGEERIVKVYSNCDRAELFLNGKSMGTKQRDSQDFPAAGLRWNVAFAVRTKPPARRRPQRRRHGHRRDRASPTRPSPGDTPAELRLTEKPRAKATPSPSRQRSMMPRASVASTPATPSASRSQVTGKLIDNLGTTRGSRELQLYNGRAEISFIRTGGCTIGVTAEGLPAGISQLS